MAPLKDDSRTLNHMKNISHVSLNDLTVDIIQTDLLVQNDMIQTEGE